MLAWHGQVAKDQWFEREWGKVKEAELREFVLGGRVCVDVMVRGIGILVGDYCREGALRSGKWLSLMQHLSALAGITTGPLRGFD